MRILSGMQPSGTLHIGNYLGALKQWVEAQSADAFYCVVDLHALTLEIEPDDAARPDLRTVATYLAAGLDPDVCTIFLQSEVPYHAQMNWLLECVATYGELSRMTQFKEKSSRKTGYRVGLLDVSGPDGRGHLALRDGRSAGRRRSAPAPRVDARGRRAVQQSLRRDLRRARSAVQPKVAARVMDLQEPTRKMSKSISSPLGSIFVPTRPRRSTRRSRRPSPTPTTTCATTGRRSRASRTCWRSIRASATRSPQAVAERYTRYGDSKRRPLGARRRVAGADRIRATANCIADP